MRTFICCLLMICTWCPLTAQPILVSSDVNPVGGNRFVRHTCGVSAFVQGAAGPGVTWDFSGLTSITTDTIRYNSCTGASICDSFPGANVYTQNGSIYNCYITDTSRFALMGEGVPGGNLYYSAPQNKIIYPMVYNTGITTTFAYSRPASTSYAHGVDSFVTDAYGTLILPWGTSANVMRVHTYSTAIDSNISGGSTFIDTAKTEVYYWYTAGFHNPLLAMYYDISGTGIPLLAQVIYYSRDTTENIVVLNDNADIRVYPNPSSGQLHIKSAANTIGSISIADIMGREKIMTCFDETQPGANELNLDISSLPPGIYLLRIQTGATTFVRKIQLSN